MSGPGMQIETWFDSKIGRVRKSNQDTVGCFREEALFIVADGMGGRAEGEVASRLATDEIHTQLSGAASVAAPVASPTLFERFLAVIQGRRVQRPNAADGEGDRLRLAIEAVNRRVFEEGQARAQTQQGSMGTTVVVLRCLLLQRLVAWAYVGDLSGHFSTGPRDVGSSRFRRAGNSTVRQARKSEPA